MSVANAPPAGRKFPCTKCGARLDYNPGERNLKCPYCGHAQDIEADTSGVVERDFEEYLHRQSAELEIQPPDDYKEVRCGGCGATVILKGKLVADRCPYCAAALDGTPGEAHALIRPESVVPFRGDGRAAATAFNAWIAKLWFAPTELKRLALLNRITGVYTPYWTYDAMTFSRYSGERGDNYSVTVRDSNGNTRSETRIAWTSVSGSVENFFDDVLVCGSKSLPAHLVQKLDNWDLAALETFRPDFLAGFLAERYAIDLEAGYGTAKEVMREAIRQLVRNDIGGDHQRVHSIDTTHYAVTFKHVLLPVYATSYRYRDRTFQVLINGQTLEVFGDRPWSWLKIARLALLVLLGIGLVVWLVLALQK